MPLTLIDQPITWQAEYCWSAARGGPGLTVRQFRLAFTLEVVPETLLIHVTADSRYKLHVNGVLLGRGPLKGTLGTYHVETYELAPHLGPGGNVLAAEVRWYGENTPMSEVHACQPGWLVHAPAAAHLATPGDWRVRVDHSVQPDTTSYHDNAQQFLNHLDRVDLRRRMGADWANANHQEDAWDPVVRVGLPTNVRSLWGVADQRQLVPRPLPGLPEEPRRFERTLRQHQVVEHKFGTSPSAWTIPPEATDTLVLDAGALTTGYPVMHVRGGADALIRLTYAEAMGFWEEVNGQREWVKHQRDDLRGEPHGYRDTVITAGRDELFEPFHWRTFRYLKIEVVTGTNPLEILDVSYRRSFYPQTLQADFESSDPQSAELWRTSWHTARLCAHETYEDCPYYEQLSYLADTRLQALLSYHLANESRLGRHCLQLYRDSVRPDGLIGARVPSAQAQVIPHFCFHWIHMVEEYWRWLGDQEVELIRSCLPAIDRVLVFFRDRLRSDGFVGLLPPWNVVDNQPGWVRGEPPAVRAGESTFLTCGYIEALDAAIRLHDEVGRPEDADRWRPWPERLRAAVQRSWCEQTGVFLEGPDRFGDAPSQHTQCAAINAGVPAPRQRQRLGAALRGAVPLLRPGLMQRFPLARALARLGSYDLMHSQVLDPWRQMLRLGSTTWWEYPEDARSDCHAWSAWIAVDFLHTVLGVQAATPGWKSIRLAPVCGALDWARGTLVTPVGRITTNWRKTGGTLHLEAETPLNVPVQVELPGGIIRHWPAGGCIKLSAPWLPPDAALPPA